MEWLTLIKESLQYIEDHLLEIKSSDEVSENVYTSSSYLQLGFQIVTGYSIGEYIRNRKLFLAALDIINNYKIIDVAYKYGYETPESFTKAFTRFHGYTPTKIKNNQSLIKDFSPLVVDIIVKKGKYMDYKIVDLFPLKLIGFVKEFDMETSYIEIPKFWDEICQKYANNIYKGNKPRNAYEQAIIDNCIGEYAVCIDDLPNGRFRYMVAGKYSGGTIPEGMIVYEFERGEWAIFDCYGPNPKTLQETNTRIFKEWLPGNKEYEIRGKATIEWYDCMNGNMEDDNYHSAIWIPINRLK